MTDSIDHRDRTNRNLVFGNNIAPHKTLIDPGSCQVPDGQTITLAEWEAQQSTELKGTE